MVSYLERQDNSLRALLDQAAEERFDKFLAEDALLDLLNERAAFRAGFQIAMKLSR